MWGLFLLHSFSSPLLAWRYTDGPRKKEVGKNRPSTAIIPLSSPDAKPLQAELCRCEEGRKKFAFPLGLEK